MSSQVGETPWENTLPRQILNIVFTTTINNITCLFWSGFARHSPKCCMFSLHNDLRVTFCENCHLVDEKLRHRKVK